MITDCKERIANIEQVLRQNDDKYDSMGLTSGLLGLSTFYYYCYIYTNEEKYLIDVSNYISKSFSGFDQNYGGLSSVRDIVEIGNYLHFLKRKGMLEDDINGYLEDADTIVLEFLDTQIVEKNIDPVLGMIKAGYYLLNRLETKNFSAKLEEIIFELEQLAISDKEKGILYWYNNFDNMSIPKLELGLTHGIAGIVNFILSVYESGILMARCKQLVIPALKFLMNQKKLEGVNLFPFEALNNDKIDYQNLCYGDLGIGYVFVRAGKILECDIFFNVGIEIIENSARFRDDNNDYIKDANLLYGASGLYSFFKTITKYDNSKSIQQARDYWFDKVMGHNQHNTPWSGYKSNYNDHSVSTQLSFSEGICGIGISLIAKELSIEGDYLTFLDFTI